MTTVNITTTAKKHRSLQTRHSSITVEWFLKDPFFSITTTKITLATTKTTTARVKTGNTV